jgi:hypothetical protein
VDFTRGQLLVELNLAAERFDANPQDPASRARYAHLLCEAGRFDNAAEILEPVAGDTATDGPKILMAQLRSLQRRYADAERLYSSLAHSGDAATRAAASAGLAMVYYQTDQYAAAAALGPIPGIDHLMNLMASYGTRTPNRIEWSGAKETAIPFHLTDPVPLLPIEVNGRAIDVFIDTGGDGLVLDPEVADELGIERVGEQNAPFAGGKTATFWTARADEVRLGSAVIRDVPIMILPTRRWSTLWPGFTCRGTVTTRVLMQFLSTIEFPNGRLALRDKQGSQAALSKIRREARAHIPFHLAATHLMMAKGSLNGKEDLTYLIDSGYASPNAFTAPVQTLRYAGIAEPELKVLEGPGGGGGDFASGDFPIERLGLGPLLQHNLVGGLGPLVPETYWSNGFIMDGLVSHSFLKKYAWTLDFVHTRMLFN